jgi:hypothetical protein
MKAGNLEDILDEDEFFTKPLDGKQIQSQVHPILRPGDWGLGKWVRPKDREMMPWKVANKTFISHLFNFNYQDSTL